MHFMILGSGFSSSSSSNERPRHTRAGINNVAICVLNSGRESVLCHEESTRSRFLRLRPHTFHRRTFSRCKNHNCIFPITSETVFSPEKILCTHWYCCHFALRLHHPHRTTPPACPKLIRRPRCTENWFLLQMEKITHFHWNFFCSTKESTQTPVRKRWFPDTRDTHAA